MVRKARQQGINTLALVVMVAGVVMVVAFVMSAASTLNLNVASNAVLKARCRAMAQAAVNEFLYELDCLYDRYLQEHQLDLRNLEGVDLNLEELYPGGDFWRQAHPDRPVPARWHLDPEMGVTITFNPDDGYFSVDNLGGSTPKRAYYDPPGSSGSVPPFTIDLIVNVSLGNTVQRYEVLVSRRWPYGVYAANGPIALTDTVWQKDSATFEFAGQPSSIQGAVYSRADLSGTPVEIPLTHYEEVDKQGNVIRLIHEDLVLDGHAVSVGAPIVVRYGDQRGDPSPDPWPLTKVVLGPLPSSGNSLADNLSFSVPERDGLLELYNDGETENYHDGIALYEVAIRNPVRYLASPNWGEDGPSWGGNRLTGDFIRLVMDYSNVTSLPDGPEFLFKDYGQLGARKKAEEWCRRAESPDVKSNPVGQGEPRYFLEYYPDQPLRDLSGQSLLWLDYTLTDHYQAPGYEPQPVMEKRKITLPNGSQQEKEEQVGWQPRSGGRPKYERAPTGVLKLDGVTLLVRGDIDLRHSRGSVRGNNTLIQATGDIRLDRVRLEARERALVIACKNFLCTGGGYLHGLILATDGVHLGSPLVSDPSSETSSTGVGSGLLYNPEAPTLTVVGGLVCGGPQGIALQSSTIVYDPAYLKALHPLGGSRVLLWRGQRD
jgi:hypothetical protein